MIKPRFYNCISECTNLGRNRFAKPVSDSSPKPVSDSAE